MTIILAVIGLAGYVLLGRIVGLPPFRGRVDPATIGRVDDETREDVWYDAANSLQVTHVQGAWDRRMAVIASEGRLFMVPGRDGRTTWDDLDTWARHAKGLPFRKHYLRIVHNHWRHDMDNDAIAMEFATAEGLAAFKAAIPEGGPEPFDFRALLGDSAPELDRLLHANRIRGDAERA